MEPWIVIVVALVALGLGAFAALAFKRGPAAEPALEASLRRLAESQAAAQAQMAEALRAQERLVSDALGQRLADFGQRVGDRLKENATESQTLLKALGERLAVIDQAQANITRLSGQVVGLQEILANKQARGAFGEEQLEALVRDLLPAAYVEFQATLSNRTRVDCLLRLPPPLGPLCVDAKFPREAYDQLRAAGGDQAARQAALRAFAAAVTKHVGDIAGKYIIPGETATAALLFVPSEAVYAEIHDGTPEVAERARRQQVYIVSPTTLWALLNTLRAVLKDTRLKEQAHLIQAEVRKLLDDVQRLDDRAGKLQRHFEQAGDDLRQIRISTEKIVRTGGRIDEMEFEDKEEAPLTLPKAG